MSFWGVMKMAIGVIFLVSSVYSGSPQCSLSPSNIFFVLDSSGSVGRANFFKLTRFTATLLADVSRGYEPGDFNSGFCTFSGEPQRVVNLKTNTTEILDKLLGLGYSKGQGTNIDAALNEASDRFKQLFNSSDYVHLLNRTSYVVLFTDGKPSGGATGVRRTREAAQALLDFHSSMRLIYIPITSAQTNLFSDMNVKTTKRVGNFNILVNTTDIYRELQADLLCTTDEPTASPSVTPTMNPSTLTPSASPSSNPTSSPSTSPSVSPSGSPSTSAPSTSSPSTSTPSTSAPSTAAPSTSSPSTSAPSTSSPSTSSPSTQIPTSSPFIPATNSPSSFQPSNAPVLSPTETPTGNSSLPASNTIDPFLIETDGTKAVSIIAILAITATLATQAISGLWVGDVGSTANGMMEVISYASFLGSTALLDLPLPVNYYQFASSLHWVNFLFVGTESSSSNGNRRLDSSDGSAVELFCATVGISPNLLFIYTLFGVFIVYAVCFAIYFFVVALRSYQKGRLSKLGKCDMIVLFAKELMVRIIYYAAYPVAIVTVYQFYVFSTDYVRDSEDKTQPMIYLSIASLVLVMYAAWLYHGVKHSKDFRYLQKIQSDNFFIYRCLILDWKYEKRYFWVIKTSTVWTRALFLGSIRTPSPIQAVAFLLTAIIYFLLLLFLKPYDQPLKNKIALVVALAYIANTIMLLVFATADLSDNQADQWGLVQVIISLFVLLGMAILCVATRLQSAFTKHTERRKLSVHSRDAWNLARQGLMKSFGFEKSSKEQAEPPPPEVTSMSQVGLRIS